MVNEDQTPNFGKIFDALPVLLMVMLSDSPKFTIVAANQAFLDVSMTSLDQILGRGLFEVFPDNPNDLHSTGLQNWRNSLLRAISNRVPDKMAVQKYDIRRNKERGGKFEQRFWSPTNIPLLDNDGQVTHIILRAEDVTEFIHIQDQELIQKKRTDELEYELSTRAKELKEANKKLRIQTDELEYEILTRAKELQETNEKLHIQDNELKQAIEDLRAAEEKFKGLVETAPDAFVIVNELGLIEVVNKQTENWFGYDRKELIGKAVELLIPERFRRPHVHLRSGFMEQPKTRPMGAGLDLYARRKDGTEFPVEISLSPMLTQQGKLVTSIIRDISEKKKNELALQELNQSLERKVLERTSQLTKEIQERKKSEEHYRLIVEAVKDYAIYMLDPNGIILSWNTGAEKIKGYTASEVLGRHFSLFYSKEDIEAGKPALELKIAAAEGQYKDESLRLKKDGSKFWGSVVISAIRDEKGELKGYAKVVRDISDRIKAATALKESYEMLETRVEERTQELVDSNKELEHFAYIASHDLQTPLRHITSYVQLVIAKIKETTKIDAEMEKWIRYITNGTQQMKSLIDDLLTYSRVGRVDTTVQEVDITKVIEEVSEGLQEPIRATNAKIIYENIPVIYGTRTQLYQLFQNLIENAIKFQKHDLAPIVTIRCEDQGSFWKFYISDNGIGFDPKFSTRIFSMFQRLHTSSEYSGTGIGLAVCKKIVESHGGEIGVDSTEGKGSTFFFTLPKKTA